MKNRTSSISELSERATEALALLTAQQADLIVGAPEGEGKYKPLIQGAEAVMSLTWAVNKTHGLRQNPASLKANAQAMAMVLTLVHYAYAFGIERGRKEINKNE